MGELYGPTCGNCGTKLRRRRVWCIGDTATCKKCGAKTECISNRPVTWHTHITKSQKSEKLGDAGQYDNTRRAT
jgi:hypothetical protein